MLPVRTNCGVTFMVLDLGHTLASLANQEVDTVLYQPRIHVSLIVLKTQMADVGRILWEELPRILTTSKRLNLTSQFVEAFPSI